jgi:hypothetical protein
MARCEDFPCCGHEAGCCPDYENGRQINMVCVCGAKLPINNRYSICDSCLNQSEYDDPADRNEEDYSDDDAPCQGCGVEGEVLNKCGKQQLCGRCMGDAMEFYHENRHDYEGEY